MDDKSLMLTLQIVGSLLGVVAFLWNLIGYIWTYILAHLQIDISNEKVKVDRQEMLKVTTTVENKGNIAKTIDFAFLLVKPDNIDFTESLFQIAKYHNYPGENNQIPILLQYLVEQGQYLSTNTINEKFIIYTLPYFYDEQFQIGNEKVKYSCVIDLLGLQTNKIYNIRFVTISYHFFKTYLRHRSTSDLFIN